MSHKISTPNSHQYSSSSVNIVDNGQYTSTFNSRMCFLSTGLPGRLGLRAHTRPRGVRCAHSQALTGRSGGPLCLKNVPTSQSGVARLNA